jgi:DNA primase
MNLQEIKKHVLLSQTVSKYIKLIKKNYLFWGKCIFHNEKTPSFVVNDEKEFYHCFGCGAHGDLFSFLMEVNKKTFTEVYRDLCILYKIPYNNDKLIVPSKIQEILNKTLEIYKQALLNNIEAQLYLVQRGITEEYITKFHICYACQNTAVTILLGEYTIKEIKEAGIISMGSFDRLRNRIIFPIFNEQNKLLAFAGRTITNEQPKYINSIETALFYKNLCLFNINNMTFQMQEIFLVEGYIDVISMTRNGFPNVVASMGTSVSKAQLFILLKRTKKIYILLDGDEAGAKASERIIDLLLEIIIPGYNIYIGTLPKGEDPDSFFRKYAPDTLKNYCKDIIETLIFKITNDLDLKNPEDLSLAFNCLYTYISKIKNESVKASYKIILEQKLKQANTRIPVGSSLKLNKTYIPSIEENIIAIIITYPDLLHEFIENLSFVIFKNIELEIIKNKLILNIQKDNIKNIIEDYKENNKIKTILLYNHTLLSKKEFCKKYLYDLIALMPINFNILNSIT